LLNEQPRLRWRLVDVEPDTSETDLLTELAVPGAFSADGTDEVFLLSRMVDAHDAGADTAASVRAGTVKTARVITAAATAAGWGPPARDPMEGMIQ
ncbi:hypothetical protein, partial [Nocardia abscessus]|uniref:hypothetical protein n=1 Tax=Nocardia abscessus TaxID=120957 RepID=UPI0024552B16